MMTAPAPTVRPSRRRIPRTRRSVFRRSASGCYCRQCRVLRKPDSWEPRRLFDNQIRNLRLLDLQIWLRLQHFAHLEAIGLFVALRSRGPHGRTARSIQQTELDADRVGDLAHDAAERVDFPHQVALRDASHGRIARHLCDQVDVQGVESGLQAHAGGGHGRLASGMAGAHDHYIELFGELHENRAERTPENP